MFIQTEQIGNPYPKWNLLYIIRLNSFKNLLIKNIELIWRDWSIIEVCLNNRCSKNRIVLTNTTITMSSIRKMWSLVSNISVPYISASYNWNWYFSTLLDSLSLGFCRSRSLRNFGWLRNRRSWRCRYAAYYWFWRWRRRSWGGWSGWGGRGWWGIVLMFMLIVLNWSVLSWSHLFCWEFRYRIRVEIHDDEDEGQNDD